MKLVRSGFGYPAAVLACLLAASHAAPAATFYYTRAYAAVGALPGLEEFDDNGGFSHIDSDLDFGDGYLRFSFGEASLATATLRLATTVQGPGYALALASMGDTVHFKEDPGQVNFRLDLEGIFGPIPMTAFNLAYVEFTAVPVGALNGQGLSTDSYYADILYRRTIFIGPENPNNPDDEFDYCNSVDCSVRNVVSIERIVDMPTAINYSFLPPGDFSFQITIVVAGTVVDEFDSYGGNFSNTAVLSYGGPRAYPESGLFPMPEPGTLSLLGVGLAVALLLSRRKR